MSRKKDGFVVRLLKFLGPNETIMYRRSYQQKQMARAVELGLGVCSGSEVDLFSFDADGREYRDQVSEALKK